MIGVTLAVEGMRCDGCAETVKALLDMEPDSSWSPSGCGRSGSPPFVSIQPPV